MKSSLPRFQSEPRKLRISRISKVKKAKAKSKAKFAPPSKNVALLDGRAVLLIRNPYEAAVSAFTHWALADHASVRTLAFLGRAIDCAKFRDKAKEVVRRWENIATDFLTMGTRMLVVHFEVWTEFPIPSFVRFCFGSSHALLLGQ